MLPGNLKVMTALFSFLSKCLPDGPDRTYKRQIDTSTRLYLTRFSSFAPIKNSSWSLLFDVPMFGDLEGYAEDHAEEGVGEKVGLNELHIRLHRPNGVLMYPPPLFHAFGIDDVDADCHLQRI
ncbi:hypothetical protein ARMGADRAFT_1035956 [Armillaria gallica]|uniref:Uncharacterized protein n=1 Tax=Armillaria gallica TaxID=47427 RepID=A0A2H3DER7_ARMGA|nr:hypothetical protein ARMGADRAFT_1035956 [Armillaria gallica]